MYGTLNTKEKRIAAREAELSRHAENGAQIVRHTDADCISVLNSHGKRTLLKVFDGTEAKPVMFESYPTQESAEEALQRHLRNRKARKAPQAAAPRELSGVALTAAKIRQELKQVFPSVAFSVRSSSYSMGNSIRVTWTDGPVDNLVDFVIDKYEYGTFDAMTDCSGIRDIDPALECPGAKFVSSSRTVSDARIAELEQYAVETFGDSGLELLECNGVKNYRHFELRFPECWPQEYRDLLAAQKEAREAAALAKEESDRKAYELEEQRRQQSAASFATADPRKVPADVEIAARIQAVFAAYAMDLPEPFLVMLNEAREKAVSAMDEYRRKAVDDRAENYTAMLLHVSEECPKPSELMAFISKSAEELYQAMAVCNAEIEKQQAEAARIDVLVAQREQELAQAATQEQTQQAQPYTLHRDTCHPATVTTKDGQLIFTVVSTPPAGTKPWNIGYHMADGYIPFVHTEGYNVVGEKYAVPCDQSAIVMAAIGFGPDTAEKMKKYVRRHPKSRYAQRMMDAIPVLESIENTGFEQQAEAARIDMIIAQREQELAQAATQEQEQAQPFTLHQLAIVAPEVLDVVLVDPTMDQLMQLVPAV